MKVIITMLLPLLFLQYVKGQEISKYESLKGYLMLVKQNNELNEIIFFPCENACKKYSFKEISKINGYLIRGQNSYKIYLAEQASEKYDVMIPRFYGNTDSTNYIPMQLYIVAVELKYQTYNSIEEERASGISFDYKGKRYLINYTDDWDIAIEDVKVIR